MRSRTRSRLRMPSLDSRGTWAWVNSWRIWWKDASVAVGGDASTTGRAGLTMRPPMVMDMGEAGVAAMVVVVVVRLFVVTNRVGGKM